MAFMNSSLDKYVVGDNGKLTQNVYYDPQLYKKYHLIRTAVLFGFKPFLAYDENLKSNKIYLTDGRHFVSVSNKKYSNREFAIDMNTLKKAYNDDIDRSVYTKHDIEESDLDITKYGTDTAREILDDRNESHFSDETKIYTEEDPVFYAKQYVALNATLGNIASKKISKEELSKRFDEALDVLAESKWGGEIGKELYDFGVKYQLINEKINKPDSYDEQGQWGM